MKTLLAMSGGVDSSVAALLLQNAGDSIGGITLQLFSPAEEQSVLSMSRAQENARLIAQKLNIPFEILDESPAFQKHVLDDFVSTYAKGRTPNPCIECNRFLKFGRLLERARLMGYERIATGHYARIGRDERSGRYVLRKALDLAKDQSYVLYGLTQEQLSRVVFPLGELTKEQVREIAQKNGFVNAHQQDSQDICFIPDGDYASFIWQKAGAEPEVARAFEPGPFLDKEGHVLGQHRGLIHYTIGQRKGLGLSSESPYYVIRLDTARNAVILSHGEGLYSTELLLNDWNLISPAELPEEIRVKAKIRYAHKEQEAKLSMVDHPQYGRVLRVCFEQPQRAATYGQSVVCYQDDNVIGGGKICCIVQ